MTDAEWRTIPGFPAYQASNTGLIRAAKPRYSKGRGSVLKPWIVVRHGRAAAYVSLHSNGVRVKCLVHRLVALAWHGLPPEGRAKCCHRNHDSLDNRAANLRWDSQSANIEEWWELRQEARSRLEADCGLLSYHGPTENGMPF